MTIQTADALKSIGYITNLVPYGSGTDWIIFLGEKISFGYSDCHDKVEYGSKLSKQNLIWVELPAV